MSNAPDWIPFQPARWIAGTAEMDMITEYVFFRLVVIAYEAGDPLIQGSAKRNAMRCKCTIEDYQEALDMLQELDKIEILEEGIFIASVGRRLAEADSRIAARQRGAAISRRRRELGYAGKKKDEIDLIISQEFSDNQKNNSDNQSGDQRCIKTNNKNNTIKTPPKGGSMRGENFALELQDEKIDPLQECVDLWNEFAGKHDLAQVQNFSETRRKKLSKRLKDCGGVDGWKVALEKVAQSNFLLGKTPGRDWKADFNFMLQEQSFTKVMEGSYSNNRNIQGNAMDELRGMKNG